MIDKTLAGIACVAIACAAGSAAAQGTSTGSTGSSAMASDQAASSGKHSTAKRRTGSKRSTSDSTNGAMASPSGGLANPKDVAPGTYNSSGGAVPKTSDPMQTKNSRDGTPLRGSGAASSTGK